MFIYMLILCALFWVMLFRFRRRRLYKLASAFPALKDSLPFVGIAHTLIGSTEDILETLQKFSYEAMNLDGIVHCWLGHNLFFVVVDPRDAEMVLRVCLEKDDLHRFMRKILGNGTLFAPVDIWRSRRRNLIPAFSSKMVDTFVKVFSEHSKRLAVRLDECVGRGKIAVCPYLHTYTFNALCESAMDVKFNTQKYSNIPFFSAMKAILNIVCRRVFHVWLQPEWLFKLLPIYSRYQEYLKLLIGFTDDVIQKKRRELENEKSPQINFSNTFESEHKKLTFLDILMTGSGTSTEYNNQELREEVLTLTFAGTDTSAVALDYTLKLLAKYPKIQAKLFSELQQVFGDSDRKLVKEDFSSLKYLERVVKESLRLFSPVPFIARKVMEDITLPSGKVLPGGSSVLISIWGIQRDPKYWGPDAEFFDPDRFLAERYDSHHLRSYIPFSAGPRNCIGFQYALMSVKAAVSSIIRHYKVVGDEEMGPAPRIRSKVDIVMRAIDDYEIAIERRSP